MAVTEKISKIIWGQCAARCCFCKADLLHQEGGRIASLIGEVAHIVGETPKAARGESDMSKIERNDADNLLLLCREHHKIVDDDPTKYSVENLQKLKASHIAWIATGLEKPRPWKFNISQLAYINVPRLCEQAELQGYAVDLSRYKNDQTLHSLGWELNHVMSAFEGVLQRLAIKTVPLNELSLHEGFIGEAISFDRQVFRTKNVPPDPTVKLKSLPHFTGNLAKDPHIYARIGQFRIVFFIDARWITTSTAFTLFRPSSGQSTFAGLGRITGVDYEARVLTATPWVIGLPSNPWDSIFEEVATKPKLAPPNISPLDALVNLEYAKRHDVHFQPPPTQCDLCRRTLANDKYMIDGAVKSISGWACMCEECFLERGRKIGWGHGQLYLRDEMGWLEVAGFPPEDEEY